MNDVLPSRDELLRRYERACDLKGPVNRGRIAERLLKWFANISDCKVTIRFLDSSDDVKKAAREAWAAREAREAREARSALAAREAREAWEARAARSALAAREAREAREAWAARAARSAREAWAAWDCAWLSASLIPERINEADNSPDTDPDRLKWLPFFEAFEAGAFCLFFTKDEICVCQIPSVVAVDDRRRLHCENGLAFAWLDDIREYYVHGVHVPEYVIERPIEITTKLIDEEPNAEVRRVMIDRYGADRYLVDSNAQEIARDDFGILFRKVIPDDEDLVMVKVVNSTPEPDGSLKDYFLRVPPTMKTAREAVAWTFDVPAARYTPALQT